MRIYTKRGDGGETDLLFGGRVSKTDPRTEAGGTVDEAVSALGLARSLSREPLVASIVEELQRALFTVGAELATASENHAKLEQHFKAVSADMTSALEAHIDALDAEVELPPSFIVPGASPASAALDLARTTLRRAERRAVELLPAPLSVAVTVLWIVLITNAFNFLDNMDGLSSGVALIAVT